MHLLLLTKWLWLLTYILCIAVKLLMLLGQLLLLLWVLNDMGAVLWLLLHWLLLDRLLTSESHLRLGLGLLLLLILIELLLLHTESWIFYLGFLLG